MLQFLRDRDICQNPGVFPNVWQDYGQIKAFGDVIDNRKIHSNPICLTPEKRNKQFSADKKNHMNTEFLPWQQTETQVL